MNEPEFFDVTYKGVFSLVHLGQRGGRSNKTLCGRPFGRPAPNYFRYNAQIYEHRAKDPTYYCGLCAWKAAYLIGVNGVAH